MSVSGKIAMTVLRTAGRLIKDKEYDVREEIRKAEAYNRRHAFRMPGDHRAVYRERTIAGYPCLIIRPKKKAAAADKAILFLHGGFKNDWKAELMVARGYAKHGAMEVWYPVYPPITEVPATETVRILYEVYGEMAKAYGGEKVAVMGDSFGGTLAFALISRINQDGGRPGMPGLLIANSPGGIPDAQEDWDRMRRYAGKDPIVRLSLIALVKDMAAAAGSPFPDAVLCPPQEDFRNAPETYVYYGEETLAGISDAYVRTYERDGSIRQMHMHIEPEMMHCYACCPVFPESRKAFYEQMDLLAAL